MAEPDAPSTDGTPEPAVTPPATETEAAADAPPPSAVEAGLSQVRDDLRDLRESLLAVNGRLTRVESVLENTAKQVSFLPPQVRMLGGKIDGLATSVGESRHRTLLLNMLAIHDLVEQMARTAAAEGELDAAHRRNYEALRTQLRQLLAANGLEEIATDGEFNPEVHRAIKKESTEDPSLANRVLQVVRSGYRTEQSVVRFAEVVVGHYTPR